MKGRYIARMYSVDYLDTCILGIDSGVYRVRGRGWWERAVLSGPRWKPVPAGV